MKAIQLFLFLLATLLINEPCFSQPVKIKVYPEIEQQKIVSIGGNFCQANYTDNAWDAVGEVTLKEFRPSHVRLALPLQFRDQDYSIYKGKKINEQPVIVTLHETMKRMKDEFGVSNFTISVWRVADELVENPNRDNKRRIKNDKYEEVIDMIVAFLVKAKEEYGVEADYFSFNESDGGYMTIFSPEETIRFFKMAGERFRKAGLKTKFLWADTAQTKGTVEFATMIAADSTIWKYLGPLCFHSWWSENIPDSEFERIAGLAQAWDKEVWCNELGFDAMAWRQRGMNATYDYALRFAKISHRMTKYAKVAVSQYWTWQNNYSIMSADTETKYPSYFITKHQVDFLNSGTQIVHSTSYDPDILPIAGIHPDGKQIIQIINTKNKPVEIEIEGFGNLKKIVSTTENNLWEEKPAQKQIITLDAESVNTLIF
ncbi:MAG TPA: hypothetical protein ENN90_08005 [Mariniphaga anaerophila]|uniref:Uncharacterized protein n=1 Tax=Mariniphaga anaerophila TaxID=1484053 RepID=A0A831LBC6_9BACT|nr:hypothetical protein [Mariniphaga anaerophila]